ncbi:hypothetical protein AHF37_01749 [Paragonimus kellicotti]|nr:hypothetical protein AHF37_01749 [Paragonimus kellicotti]
MFQRGGLNSRGRGTPAPGDRQFGYGGIPICSAKLPYEMGALGGYPICPSSDFSRLNRAMGTHIPSTPGTLFAGRVSEMTSPWSNLDLASQGVTSELLMMSTPTVTYGHTGHLPTLKYEYPSPMTYFSDPRTYPSYNTSPYLQSGWFHPRTSTAPDPASEPLNTKTSMNFFPPSVTNQRASRTVTPCRVYPHCDASITSAHERFTRSNSVDLGVGWNLSPSVTCLPQTNVFSPQLRHQFQHQRHPCCGQQFPAPHPTHERMMPAHHATAVSMTTGKTTHSKARASSTKPNWRLSHSGSALNSPLPICVWCSPSTGIRPPATTENGIIGAVTSCGETERTDVKVPLENQQQIAGSFASLSKHPQQKQQGAKLPRETVWPVSHETYLQSEEKMKHFPIKVEYQNASHWSRKPLRTYSDDSGDGVTAHQVRSDPQIRPLGHDGRTSEDWPSVPGIDLTNSGSVTENISKTPSGQYALETDVKPIIHLLNHCESEESRVLKVGQTGSPNESWELESAVVDLPLNSENQNSATVCLLSDSLRSSVQAHPPQADVERLSATSSQVSSGVGSMTSSNAGSGCGAPGNEMRATSGFQKHTQNFLQEPNMSKSSNVSYYTANHAQHHPQPPDHYPQWPGREVSNCLDFSTLPTTYSADSVSEHRLSNVQCLQWSAESTMSSPATGVTSTSATTTSNEYSLSTPPSVVNGHWRPDSHVFEQTSNTVSHTSWSMNRIPVRGVDKPSELQPHSGNLVTNQLNPTTYFRDRTLSCSRSEGGLLHPDMPLELQPATQSQLGFPQQQQLQQYWTQSYDSSLYGLTNTHLTAAHQPSQATQLPDCGRTETSDIGSNKSLASLEGRDFAQATNFEPFQQGSHVGSVCSHATQPDTLWFSPDQRSVCHVELSNRPLHIETPPGQIRFTPPIPGSNPVAASGDAGRVCVPDRPTLSRVSDQYVPYNPYSFSLAYQLQYRNYPVLPNQSFRTSDSLTEINPPSVYPDHDHSVRDMPTHTLDNPFFNRSSIEPHFSLNTPHPLYSHAPHQPIFEDMTPSSSMTVSAGCDSISGNLIVCNMPSLDTDNVKFKNYD